MKYLLFVIALFLTFSIEGQETQKSDYQISIGPSFSIPLNKSVISKGNGHIYDTKYYYKCAVGFNVELNYIYNINEGQSVVTGINYEYNNLHTDLESYGITLKFANFSQRVNIPFEYRFNLIYSIPIHVGIGGYVGTELINQEKGIEYIDISKISNDTLQKNPQIIEIPYNSYNYKGFTLTYGLSLRLEYLIKLNEKIGLTVFSKCSYGWNSSTNNFFKPRKDLSCNLFAGLGIKL